MSPSNIVTRHEGRLFVLLVFAASYLLDFITQSPEMQKHLFPYRELMVTPVRRRK